MSLLVYKPGELVAYRASLQLLDRHIVRFMGNRIQAIACQGPGRLLHELVPILVQLCDVKLLDLERLLEDRKIRDPYTLVFQLIDGSHRQVAWQISSSGPGNYHSAPLAPYRHQVFHGTTPGTLLTAAVPPPAAGEAVSALTYATCRCLGRSAIDKEDVFLYSNGQGLQTYTFSDLLETIDGAVRLSRQTL